jgi:hypothetical protein
LVRVLTHLSGISRVRHVRDENARPSATEASALAADRVTPGAATAIVDVIV